MKKHGHEEKKKKKRKHSGNFHLKSPSYIIQILVVLHQVANPDPGHIRKKVFIQLVTLFIRWEAL